MNIRRAALLTPMLFALTTGSLTLGVVPALADPPSNGCPAGYELMSVETMTSLGYHVPAAVDSPISGIHSFGQPGNGDGYVCGVKLGNRVGTTGLQLYNFMDNQLPASSNHD